MEWVESRDPLVGPSFVVVAKKHSHPEFVSEVPKEDAAAYWGGVWVLSIKNEQIFLRNCSYCNRDCR